MELMEHLTELRARIIRVALYVVGGMVLTYSLFDYIYSLLSFPLQPLLNDTVPGGRNNMLAFHGIQEAFLLRMQVAFISGLVVAFPLIVLELWGFIEPALTAEERKPVKYLAPFSVLLFLAGVGTGYACLPATFTWMASYIHDLPNVSLIQDAQQYIVLTVKIMLAFGISFQLPLVLLFLARIGLITADLMTTYWRHATVGISVAAMILTPSNDPLTMLMMAIPMAGLYLLSIGLVRAFEPKADGSRTPGIVPLILVALAPLAIIMAVGFWLVRATAHQKLFPKTPAAVTTPAPGTPAAGTIAPSITSNAAEIQTIQAQIDTLGKRLNALEAASKNAPANITDAPSVKP